MKKLFTMDCCEKMIGGQTGGTVLSAFMTFSKYYSETYQERLKEIWLKTAGYAPEIEPFPFRNITSSAVC